MKLQVIDKDAKKVGEVELNLEGSVRADIFKKAVLAENSLFRSPSGADPMAGRRSAISLSKRRRKLRTTYGRGGSRTPRKVMWSRGTQFRFVGAFAPNTVGGRRAHPPKAEKITFKNMNNKEWMKALVSGVLASLNKEVVESNGQKLPTSYPFVLDDKVETITKTKDFKDVLEKLGFAQEIERTSETKIRAGIGKMRGRKYKVKRGPLVVISSLEAPLLKAVRNVKGFDVVTPEFLMASDFGMSEKPGRAVIFTKSAIEEFKEVLA
ncbi:MAG: 50S ribosomal protein L4 [Nanoarchaeota archaeon]